MTSRDGMIECTLCAHRCRISDGNAGLCMVRTNEHGSPRLPYYAEVSALHVDPIEKKPLYHLHPGAMVLSLGFLGCNFRCPFCQNFSISQSTRSATRTVLPADLPGLARDSGAGGVAYTYNEPTVHFEYLMEAADAVHDAGYGNVLVTNGHLTRGPARELLARMDGANVDLKSYSADFYRKELRGSLEAVKEFIAIAAELTHVEVTTLLIPGRNDSDEEIESIAGFLASIDRSIPFHLSAYHPTYRYEVHATPPATVERARRIAADRLEHVYLGNAPGDASTRCAACGAVLVQRRGYSVDLAGLAGRCCAGCGAGAPFKWFEP
jgi:pyruvate formate lyase activating enzyme